jgi:RNA polymerase sigma-70 factor, ECF subfamily
MQPIYNINYKEQISRRAKFDAQVKRSHAKVYHQAYRLLNNASEAEDATQEAFLNAWHSFHRFDAAHLPVREMASAWDAWLRRIVTNVAYNRLRTQRRKLTLSLNTSEEGASGDSPLARIPDNADKQPERLILAREYHDEVKALLNALPKEQATVLRLHIFDQFSYQEIADRVGCAVGTVRSRIHRACARLRGRLTENMPVSVQSI